MAFNYEKKIGALLAKAEAEGATPEEREAFLNKALAMMVRTGVDEAQARAAVSGEKASEEIVTGMVFMNGVYHLGYRSLATYVTRGLGGLQGYSQQTKQTETVYYIVGFEKDVLRAKALVESLMRQAFSSMQAWWTSEGSEQYGWRGAQFAKKARRSFIVSFGAGVHEKLKLVYGEVVAEGGVSTELAIRDRQSAVDDWVSQNLNLKVNKGFEAQAVGAGIAAGRNADIGQSQMRGSRGAIGG